MRLLVVSQYFWPENFRINDVVQGLVERGHEVTVLTAIPNYPEGKVFEEYRKDPEAFSSFAGVAVVRAPIVPRGSSKLQLALNYASFVISGSLVGAWKLRGRKFDAIFVFMPSPITLVLPGLLLRRMKKAPLLFWVLDLWPDALRAIGVVKSPRLLALVGRLVRFIYRRCDRILAQSRAFVDNIAAYAGGRERVLYFPGWPEAVFEAGPQKVIEAPELRPFEGHFKLLFAGNLGEAQDFPTILEAADLLRDDDRLKLVVVGDGRAGPMIRTEIDRRGLQHRVVLLGRYPLERMPSFFSGADALLVSLSNDPGWAATIPGKVQSYLAAGKPIIGVLNGEGAAVIRESGGGVVGPAGDARALAANIRSLMDMSQERLLAMGKAGQEYGAREFGRSMLLDRLEQWLEDAVEQHPDGVPARY